MDAGIVTPDVGHGQRDQFCEGSRAVDSDAGCVGAEMAAAGEAVAAASANDMALAADDIARVEVVYVGTDLDDLADELMADGHGHGDGLLGPLVPLIDVNVGSADAGVPDADQDVVDADGRFCDVFKPQAAFRAALY